MNTPHPPIKAVLFDLDGTLLDTLPDLHVAANAMLRDMGRPELPLYFLSNLVCLTMSYLT